MGIDNLGKIIESKWEPLLTTEWEFHFKEPSFDYERYEQLKQCFDSFMNKNEDDKENISKCIFPMLKRIKINYDVDLKPIHSKY